MLKYLSTNLEKKHLLLLVHHFSRILQSEYSGNWNNFLLWFTRFLTLLTKTNSYLPERDWNNVGLVWKVWSFKREAFQESHAISLSLSLVKHDDGVMSNVMMAFKWRRWWGAAESTLFICQLRSSRALNDTHPLQSLAHHHGIFEKKISQMS